MIFISAPNFRIAREYARKQLLLGDKEWCFIDSIREYKLRGFRGKEHIFIDIFSSRSSLISDLVKIHQFTFVSILRY